MKRGRRTEGCERRSRFFRSLGLLYFFVVFFFRYNKKKIQIIHHVLLHTYHIKIET